MKKIMMTSLAALLLSGCSFIPDYTRPNTDVPLEWSQETKTQTASVDEATAWWNEFESDELNTLMTLALSENTDLRAGIQRIEQSRASLRIAGATLLPSASGSAGASRSKSNPSSGNSSYSSSLTAGIDISYELDLFGSNRASIEAAKSDLKSTIYDQGALKLTLMGDVATGYFTLINLRERLDIADSNLTNAREVLRIINARVEAGAESDLELAQQKSAVATSEASRASIIEQITNAENALAILLGQSPQSIDVETSTLSGLNIPNIAAGQPSTLLERRPDLLSSEASLKAANADIGAARSAFFPSLSIGLGETISTTAIGDPSATVISLASSLSAPIFQGGRLKAGVEQATARQLELLEDYRGNILTSFQEVEDALAAVKAAQSRETSLKTAMEQARLAYKLSKNQYDAGAIDFQTLLDTQTAQLSAEDTYAQSRLALLTSAINLYRALGGGWDS